jgi:hypothetical protein
MNDRTLVVVGYPMSRERDYVLATGPFRDQDEAEDYIRDVLAHQRFKYQFTWKAIPVSDPDIYRPRSGDVLA